MRPSRELFGGRTTYARFSEKWRYAADPQWPHNKRPPHPSAVVCLKTLFRLAAYLYPLFFPLSGSLSLSVVGSVSCAAEKKKKKSLSDGGPVS